MSAFIVSILLNRFVFLSRRYPMDSYPNIDSRDSPGGSCSILDETDNRLGYKKSIFRTRKSYSSANMVGTQTKEKKIKKGLEKNEQGEKAVL